MTAELNNVAAELIAVLVTVAANCPTVLTISHGALLPSGPLSPEHRSLQAGVRAWVERQTHHPLGYVEQLYTFADNDRAGGADNDRAGGTDNNRAAGFGRAISISYLGLTREQPGIADDAAAWCGWYEYFPWEDRRAQDALNPALAEALQNWVRAAGDEAAVQARRLRVAVAFGQEGRRWNEEIVLQRYELLYEAGLVPEAGNAAALGLGRAMRQDHRRILATGIARLRAKITYRPVVFELMPPQFTLLDLQLCVEALAGRLLHKQNFRRLVEQQALVEETGQMAAPTGGRPAKLFRFRADILQERAYAGTKPPLARS